MNDADPTPTRAATSRPWEQRGNEVWSTTKTPRRISVLNWAVSAKTDLANARLIVEAVNFHDELKAQLERSVRALELGAQEIASLTAERDSLRSERDQLKAERDGLRAEVNLREKLREAMESKIQSLKAALIYLSRRAPNHANGPCWCENGDAAFIEATEEHTVGCEQAREATGGVE